MRGGKFEPVEGKLRSRIVVIEFPELSGGARLLSFAGIPGRLKALRMAQCVDDDLS